jgi:AAA family ATP:ADP antiporter
MSYSGNAEFGRLRSYLWPIHRGELKKLLPMLLMFFLISFDYNILRTMKDSLIVTAKNSGAEVIPFIKVWVMFPGSILLTYIFTRLSNRLARETVFYVMLSVFLLFFFCFAFIIYPARDLLHPEESANTLQALLPQGFKGLIAMYRYWTFTSFYVMAELWSNIILAMLFWGFANQVTKLGEAKRFYGILGVGANLSGIVAGSFAIAVSEFFGANNWESEMNTLILTITAAGVAVMFLFRWFNKVILADPQYYAPEEHQKEEVRGKMSMRANFAYLFQSRYLISIALIVIAYNLVINLTEVLWKHEVRALYPDTSSYNRYTNEVMTFTGFIATGAAYLISGNSIRKFGWTFTAMLTPLILLVTSVGFFGFFFLKRYPDLIAPFLGGMTPLGMAVFFGTAQNMMSRAAKYSVFDATKEMAFIPLSPESRLKGKAAVDGVCARFGKAGGSAVHQSLLIMMGSLTASAPIVSVFLFSAILVWMGAVMSLGRRFNALTDKTASAERPSLVGDKLQEQQA